MHPSTPCLPLFTLGGIPTCPQTRAPGLHGPGVTRVLPGASPHRTLIRGCDRGVLRERECSPPPPSSPSIYSSVPPYGGASVLLRVYLPLQAGYFGAPRLFPPPLREHSPYWGPAHQGGRRRLRYAAAVGGILLLRCAAADGGATCVGCRRRCRPAVLGGHLHRWAPPPCAVAVVSVAPPLRRFLFLCCGAALLVGSHGVSGGSPPDEGG